MAQSQPAASRSLDGVVAVITGANRGIGLAIATLFAQQGAQCVLAVRDRAAGETAADQVAKMGARPFVIRADVSDRGEVASLAMDVSERFTGIEILVNNAGVLLDADRKTPVSGMDPEVFAQTMAVNLGGAINMCEALLPQIGRGGRIINVSSTMGQLTGGSAGYAPAYCISKTALNAYTQALAADVRSRGIMVDAFHPGWATTRMGGAGASVAPEEAALVALHLATRPFSEETGLFWDHTGIIEW